MGRTIARGGAYLVWRECHLTMRSKSFPSVAGRHNGAMPFMVVGEVVANTPFEKHLKKRTKFGPPELCSRHNCATVKGKRNPHSCLDNVLGGLFYRLTSRVKEGENLD